jgi:hypothetical protein
VSIDGFKKKKAKHAVRFGQGNIYFENIVVVGGPFIYLFACLM